MPDSLNPELRRGLILLLLEQQKLKSITRHNGVDPLDDSAQKYQAAQRLMEHYRAAYKSNLKIHMTSTHHRVLCNAALHNVDAAYSLERENPANEFDR